MASPPNLVIGCGYLGRRVAAAWREQGRRVAALTRGRAEELAALGLEPINGDVLDPASLRSLPAADTVLYAVGLDRSAGRSMREVYVEGLANVLAALPSCERFLYVGSTSVYGQTDGSVVTEESPTEPLDDSGRVCLEAEHLLRLQRPDAIVLRFAGIYGPGRQFGSRLLSEGKALPGNPDRYLNLIHVEDGVQAVLAAEQRGQPGATYLIADDEPVRRRDYYTHLAQQLGAPAPRIAAGAARDANRRISNRKAREELGFLPRYRSYIEGLERTEARP